MDAHLILLYLLNTAEVLACICALLTRRKWAGTHWRWFAWYLLFVVFAEMIGNYANYHKIRWLNHLLYQEIVIPVEFGIIFYLYYAIARGKTKRLLPILCAVLYATAFVADAGVIHLHDRRWFSMSYMTGTVLVLILAMRYFITLAGSVEILHFRANMLFWVSTGWIIYYVGTACIYGAQSFVSLRYARTPLYFRYITDALNIVMYLLFAIGFLWNKPRSQYS